MSKGLKDRERAAALALTHARLHAAADLLRWSLNAAAADVVPRDDVLRSCEQIKAWEDATWAALREAAGAAPFPAGGKR
jgi:hypothetical protein